MQPQGCSLKRMDLRSPLADESRRPRLDSLSATSAQKLDEPRSRLSMPYQVVSKHLATLDAAALAAWV